MELHLKEDYLMLCLHPEKGSLVNSGYGFIYGLAGAILLDLIIQEKVIISKNRIQVPVSRPDPDRIFNEVMQGIHKKGKPASFKTWVTNLGMRSGRYKKIISETLNQAGYLRRKETSFLFLHFSSYHIGKREHLNAILEELRLAVSGKNKPDEYQLALLSLLDASQGLKSVYPDRLQRKEARIKIRGMMRQDLRISPVIDAIRETQAAVAALTATTAASV
jgi:hypothetical protein